jgi:hypothetical protein
MNRSHTISTKVDADEKAWLQKRADAARLTRSEYFRNVLIAEREKPDELMLLAAEFRAMRSILFQLVTASLTGQRLTDTQIQQIVSAADAAKYQRAEESLLSLQQATKGHADAI